MKRVAFLSAKVAGIVETTEVLPPLKPDEVRGRTLVSLVSPGTERSLLELASFPFYPGYAAVFRVDEKGEDVADLAIGDKVFCSGPHQEIQTFPRGTVATLPRGLDPAVAVFARLAGVSMSTLNTAATQPPARVLVTGLGPVGNLAAQIFARCGYEVTAVDPVEERRKLAIQMGVRDVRVSISEGFSLEDTISIAVECSGHEQAALDACRCLRKRGEVVVVGRNWKKYTDLSAHDLLEAVFKRYAVLRSGWEWEVPMIASDFHPHSLMANYAVALRWLSEGSLQTSGFAETYSPDSAYEVYSCLLTGANRTPCAIFDWQRNGVG